MSWNLETYQSRIADPAVKIRHAAGSPCAEEIENYLLACAGADFNGTALVLGMTPELRTMALRNFKHVISVDHSEVAIEMFSDWVPEGLRERETLIHGLWADLIGLECEVIFGDGIVANLLDFATTLETFRVIRSLLSPSGRCVMRNVVVCAGIDPQRFRFEKLRNDFRKQDIDAAEFGFSARMLGFHGLAYDDESEILDCERVYEALEVLAREGKITEDELTAVSWYRFMGKNFFPKEKTWVKLVREAGFGIPQSLPSFGKLWNAYYPVQVFSPEPCGSGTRGC